MEITRLQYVVASSKIEESSQRNAVQAWCNVGILGQTTLVLHGNELYLLLTVPHVEY